MLMLDDAACVVISSSVFIGALILDSERFLGCLQMSKLWQLIMA